MVNLPDSELGLAYYALEWAIRIGALIAVPFRRSPAATRAWLLLIFFLPVPGLLLFWTIGSPRFPEWRRDRFGELDPWFGGIAARLAPHAPPPDPIVDLAAKLGKMPATGGNRVDLIFDYIVAIDRLVADINAAQHSIRILVYIFADDAVGQRVADALGAAVKRGVTVQVMYDPVGSRPWRKGMEAMLTAAGGRGCGGGGGGSCAPLCRSAGSAGGQGATCATIASCS